ncbi:cbb3-type cytochrome c oxidase subunit I [Pelagibacterium luteolum]|uniref:Cytochrome c oxidase cbb3-type subunit 1 n=1 Tax=Pelagibacterium luteolum TaxID=440168 RepID=A0A1G7Z2R1_9HYPH|nr:cbb3-type cytochrome c oxidase subunit I [Pelagibacterium luteolum]SDH03061.1 cytochrome c oxidase cbb3-type subunit 1 [Pelagibacterium luteolum]
MVTMGLLLALSFVVSLLALAFLIWAISNKQVAPDQHDARVIFEPGDEGHVDSGETATSRPYHFDTVRSGIDAVSTRPVAVLLIAATVWLVIGSVFGLVASLKLHWPDWLSDHAALTFGRVRTLHLNLVIYGWLSQVGIAAMIWVLPRIFHTPLRAPRLPLIGAALWNAAVLLGAIAIANGWTDGEEWLEIPWQLDLVLALAGVFFMVPLIKTTLARQVHHIYVTGWYFLAGILWFPCLFVIANLPYVHSGVEEATVNWWFAHNVLGLWLTPIGVGTAYYFIPKIIGKPVFSYAVSLIGFWGLALFYSQVGIHHLIGGPVPTWVATLSVVHSVMMFIPVIAVAINQHITVGQNLWALKESLPLRFIAFGALMYTMASFQGSIEALRSVNSVTHFTHYTVGHAHLGAYAFVTITMFGAVYHMLPRMTGRVFRWPALINAHFWLVVIGFAIYFFGLSIGGWLQGLAMLDGTRPFSESVILTKPYLEARSVGGALMTLGHLVFAFNVASILLPQRVPESVRTVPAE